MKKKNLLVNDYMVDKLLDKIKKTIGIIKFNDTKILIDVDDELPNYINVKNVEILTTCAKSTNILRRSIV